MSETTVSRPTRSAGTSRSAKTPRFADPWSLRDCSCRCLESTADQHGRPTHLRFYRRGGILVCAAPLDELTPLPVPGSRRRPNGSSLAVLRRRKAATFARYRLAGWCTAVELSTIDALWFEGVSLRQLSKREGVSPAAISDRIAGLRRKAPEFANWWRLKHYTRQRRRLNVG